MVVGIRGIGQIGRCPAENPMNRWGNDAVGQRISVRIRGGERDAFGTSSFVLTDWSLATGGSLVAVTVMETVAILESTVPSFALKVKESGPL